ncbi:MAG: QueT transporter family protein [Clostridiales bacterium]|jgi:uncharacterized membrane protein|nr:QueT transporter family protein [Clostridiales bacterium]
MSTRKIAFAAVVGAVYAALTIALAPISYGAVQFRISEALCVLPFFFPFSAWGLFAGCVIANLLSAYGVPDVVFGSLATLLAALCTMAAGKTGGRGVLPKALACLPPVIFNGLIVGAVIAYGITGISGASKAFWPTYAIVGLQVGLGELAVMYILGFPALVLLPKTGFFKTITSLYAQR